MNEENFIHPNHPFPYLSFSIFILYFLQMWIKLAGAGRRSKGLSAYFGYPVMCLRVLQSNGAANGHETRARKPRGN